MINQVVPSVDDTLLSLRKLQCWNVLQATPGCQSRDDGVIQRPLE